MPSLPDRDRPPFEHGGARGAHIAFASRSAWERERRVDRLFFGADQKNVARKGLQASRDPFI
jgi:hypothetical protein